MTGLCVLDLLSIYHVPGAVLSQLVYYLIKFLQQLCEVIIPILQIRKLRNRWVKQLVQGLSPNK